MPGRNIAVSPARTGIHPSSRLIGGASRVTGTVLTAWCDQRVRRGRRLRLWISEKPSRGQPPPAARPVAVQIDMPVTVPHVGAGSQANGSSGRSSR